MIQKAGIVCDVAVVGAGFAGLTAGVRAAQGGRKVLVFEKLAEDLYVCNSRLTGGVFHVALSDIFSDEEMLERRIMDVTGGAAKRELARAVARDAKRVVAWLQGFGVRFIRGSPDPWHSRVLAPPAIAQLGRRWQGRGGDVLLRTLETELKKAGGEIRRGHRAQELRKESDRCVGFTGVTANGEEFEVSAQATILADGGFQADPERLRGPITPAPEKVVQRNAGTGTGDGLRMAQAFGAAITDLKAFYGHLLSRDALTNDALWPYPWVDLLARSCMVVGSDGRRFVDEGLGGTYIANQIAKLPNPASSAVVFDQAGWDGPGTERFLPPNPNMIKVGGTIFKANALPELAKLAGISEAGLLSEVESYNRALKLGTLEQLSPPRTTSLCKSYPIEKAPFYAIPLAAGITYTMGGISIDECSRALRPNGTFIPGLYAAGNTIGGIEGGEKVGYVGGLCISTVTGLRAGEHIVGALAA